MGLWERIRNYLASDIEISLAQRPEAPYATLHESTELGGAITKVSREEDLRVVFHDGFPMNFGSFVLLHSMGDGSVVTVYRTSRDSVTIFVSRDSGDSRTKEHRLRIGVGQTKAIADPLNRPIFIRRIRHRDFVL